MAFWLRRIVGECLALFLCALPMAAQARSIQPVLICSPDSSCITFNEQGVKVDPLANSGMTPVILPYYVILDEYPQDSNVPIQGDGIAQPDASGLFGVRPTVRVKLTNGSQTWYQDLPVTRRTADKSFWLSTGLSLALTVADVENSLHALNRPGVSEANPLFGGHPSRLRYYAIAGPIAALNIGFSWHYKRQDDAMADAGIKGHKYVKWFTPNLLNTAFHALGLAVTIGSTGR